MKVLKPGIDKLGTWKKVVKCDGRGCYVKNSSKDLVPCEAELEVNYKDIFVNSVQAYSSDTAFMIKCPDCGSYTCIVSSELPDYIRMYARKRTEKDIDDERGFSHGSDGKRGAGIRPDDGRDYLDLE